MRNNPTEPEKRLWRILSGSKLAGSKFRRQAVLPPYIVDFLCPALHLIVEVDGDTHGDPAVDARRDSKLMEDGSTVLHVKNADVMGNPDGVAEVIADAIRIRQVTGRAPHPNPFPEGEGLS